MAKKFHNVKVVISNQPNLFAQDAEISGTVVAIAR